MISYLTLIRALKASPDGITFTNAPNEVYEKVVNLFSAGCIELTFPSNSRYHKVTIATVRPQSPETEPTPVIEQAQAQVNDSTKKIPAIGDTAVLSSARGIASNPHKIIDFNNGYAVLQHPVLRGNLYRKVVWNETVQGWVA